MSAGAIRRATRADLPAIVAIYNATIPGRMATADLVPVTVEQREPWLADRDDAHPVWVGVDDGGTVVAWLSVSRFHARAAYDVTAELGVYVAEDARGAGWASRLIEHAIATSQAAGLRTLMALVFDHNAPSLALFEAFGFTRWGHYPRICELDAIERGVVALGLRIDGGPG